MLDNEDDAENGAGDDDPPVATAVAGLNIAPSSSDFTTTYSFLRNRLLAGAGTRIVVQVDHRANAAGLGQELRPTAVVTFTNPAQAAPLIQAEPLAGLDLPQTMLVYQKADGDVAVAFNDPDYLRARYGLADRGEALAAMDETLTMLAQDAAGNAVATRGSSAAVARAEGIVISDSGADFATTVTRLRNAINASVGLNLIEVVDHRVNAARVGLSVNPAALFVFAYPQPGVALMQAKQTTAIDLPQRILVYQTDTGEVRLAYNDPAYIAARHGVAELQQATEAIAVVLSDLAAAATAARQN